MAVRPAAAGDAVNAETGVRGYAAIRDPLFLAPYSLTLSRIGAERGLLRTAAAIDGYRRQQMVDATTGRVLLRGKVAGLATARRLLASGAFAYPAKPIELAGLGKPLDTFAASQAHDQQAQPATRIGPA